MGIIICIIFTYHASIKSEIMKTLLKFVCLFLVAGIILADDSSEESTECSEHSDCKNDEYCSFNPDLDGFKYCEDKAPNGARCIRDAKCLSGNCEMNWAWDPTKLGKFCA